MSKIKYMPSTDILRISKKYQNYRYQMNITSFAEVQNLRFIGVKTGFSNKKRTVPYKKLPDYSKGLRTGKIWPA